MSYLTPIEQWTKIKAEYPDTIIMIRVGDFYETYGVDAQTCHTILGLTITTRHSGTETLAMAGFPAYYIDDKLAKLVQAGQRVALVEPKAIPIGTLTAD